MVYERKLEKSKKLSKSVDKWVPAWYYSQALERDDKKRRPEGLSEKKRKERMG